MLTETGFTFSKCYLCVGRVDMRKGIDGLASIVRLRYNLDPLDRDTLFLFCGGRKDRIKGLLWTGDRFILLIIRLADGRFSWPQNEDEARKLTGEEFQRLMKGFTVDPSIGVQHQAPAKKSSRQVRRKTILKISAGHG